MADQTALARQLKKLAVPQSTLLIQDKIRKSFLFDHREAAAFDRDLIFSYGTNGIEKLRNINALFLKFESNLFSLSYKEFERSVYGKDVNKKLDEKISEFLHMLSPYFLIRAAHEALEWLIYRFHIHMFNIDDLIASALPHYNSSAFVRIVQLLDLDENSRWFWLKPIQKTGVHLEYSAILNRFISDGGFRKFICDIAPNMLKVYKNHENIAVPIVSFSMLTVYNALVKYQSMEDKLIVFLFPYILSGLNSDLSKYVASAYLIISQIVLKVKLTSETIENLLIRIFQTVNDELLTEAFELLILIFQNQTINFIPKKVYSIIVSKRESVNILTSLVSNYKSFSLIQEIIKYSIVMLFKTSNSAGNNNKKIFKFFRRLLSNIKLNEASAILCFNMTLKIFAKFYQTEEFKRRRKQFKKIGKYILKHLEVQYPDYFDKAYKKFLKGKLKLKNKLLYRFINESVCSVKYLMIPNIKTSLILGLNHASHTIRLTSVDYLLDLISVKNIGEEVFVKCSLFKCLFDKNPEIVLKVLSSDVILQVIGKSKLLAAFEELFCNNIDSKSNWFPVQMKCLEIIATYYGEKEDSFDIFPLIISFLFPVNEHTMKGFLYLLNSDVKNELLEELKVIKSIIDNERDINASKILKINCMIVSLLKTFIEKMNQEYELAFALFLKSKISNLKNNSFLYFYLYAIQYLIVSKVHSNKDSILKYIKLLLHVCQSCFSDTSMVFEKYGDRVEVSITQKAFEFLNKNAFPTIVVYDTFYNVITGINVNLDCKIWPDLKSDQDYAILTILFDFCILNMSSGKKLVREYFKSMLSLLISHQLRNIQKTVWFLCSKWTNYTNDVPYSVQLSSIQIATTLCFRANCTNWLFCNDMIFLCLVKSIANPNIKVSHSALSLLTLYVQYSESCVYPLKFLAEEICSKSEEIKVDYRYCFDCIGNSLKPVIENTNSKMLHSAIDKSLQNKKLILNKLLTLLTEDIPHSMKYFILSCLQNIDNPAILSAYIPVLYNYLNLLENYEENKEYILLIIELLLKKYTTKTAKYLTENSTESKALLHCLNYGIKEVQIHTLNILNKDFFSAIPSIVVQQEIFEILLTIYMNSSTDVNVKIEKVLRKLCSYAFLFLKYFQDKELSTIKGTTLKEAKKSHIEDTLDNAKTFENGSWKKIIVFLELLQNKSKLINKDILVQDLFNLLNKSLEFDSQAPVEYLKQLILSAIHSCCQQLGSSQLDERQFQVELIVQCIRSSTNAKTHHQSLLLLNLAATMFPEYVLSNVMSIFTFMGSSLIRQDDSYSFQVISQTIETIVPSLLEASNQQTETDGIQVVSSVIRVFVDSLSDIPGHRQLPLFTKLISTLDPSKYLWIPLGQICNQYVTLFHDINIDDSKNFNISPTLEFALNLHMQFSPDIQIDTCIKLMKFLLKLVNIKREFNSNPDIYQKIKEPFNISNHTDKQLQLYIQNVLLYMKIWLSSQAFLSQVSELNNKQQFNLENKYELLLESIMSFLQDCLSIKQHEKNVASHVELIYSLIHTINSLLPCTLFLRVIRHLLKHSQEEIQVKAIELLNTKLEQEDWVHSENHKVLIIVLNPLLKLVDKCVNEDTKVNKYFIGQTALYALHLLTKLIGSEYPSKFYKVLKITITILHNENQPELTVNALLCLGQLCNCLNVDMLPHLNSFMPIIINILQDKKILNMSECLILGIIAALQSIIENLGIFLSNYMEAMITSICIFSVRYSELGKKLISEKFINMQSKIANEISLRVLLTAIQSSYSTLSSENAYNIVPLMKILIEKLNTSNYEDILGCSSQLQIFYISLLDFRNCNQHLQQDTVSQVENNIISSLETFVMKLSVTRFRIFFQKIYQWSTSLSDEQEQKYRIYTFYKVTSVFSKSLKSLFSYMAKYFFHHASIVIDANNISKSKVSYFDSSCFSQELLFNVIDTLNYSFMHAEDQFLDKENFNLLMQPLVDQIENLDESFYQNLIENHLSNCVAYFMTTVCDATLWKSLNYQILLKTRHESPKVRFGALQVIQEVVNKMGDNYLVLLPESIPFLAEMMEDESTEVEQECQNVIIEMEKILGEPIRKYF